MDEETGSLRSVEGRAQGTVDEEMHDEVSFVLPFRERAMTVEEEEAAESVQKQAPVDDDRVCCPTNDVHAGEGTDPENDISKDQLFPWVNQKSNTRTRLAQEKLMKRYRDERVDWSIEMHEEFRRVAPTMDFSFHSTTNRISNLNHDIRQAGHSTWIDSWFSRVLFGSPGLEEQRLPSFAEEHLEFYDLTAGRVVSNDENITDDSCVFSRELSKKTSPLVLLVPKPRTKTDTPEPCLGEQTEATTSNEATSHNDISDTHPDQFDSMSLSSLDDNEDDDSDSNAIASNKRPRSDCIEKKTRYGSSRRLQAQLPIRVSRPTPIHEFVESRKSLRI